MTQQHFVAPDVAAAVLFYLVGVSDFIQFLYVLVYEFWYQSKALDLLHTAVSSDYSFMFSIMDYSCGFMRLS